MFTVIEDQSDFLLISKDPDISFHKEENEEGLVQAIRRQLNMKELYTLHRLDRVTSGLLLFAKSSYALNSLSVQFRKNLVRKYYLAISDKKPKKKQGLIRGDMAKARRGAWKLLRTTDNPAITQFFSTSLGNNLRLFLIKPHTGRTHQIRVALKSIGAPVLGDPLYHSRREQVVEADRTYLHAYAISFLLDRQIYRFEHKPGKGRYFINDAFLQAMEHNPPPWDLTWPKVK